MIDLIILAALVCVLCVAVYFIAQVSTKETPFEQAVAEQRQEWEREYSRPKVEKHTKRIGKVKKIKSKKEDHEVKVKDAKVHSENSHTYSRKLEDFNEWKETKTGASKTKKDKERTNRNVQQNIDDDQAVVMPEPDVEIKEEIVIIQEEPKEEIQETLTENIIEKTKSHKVESRRRKESKKNAKLVHATVIQTSLGYEEMAGFVDNKEEIIVLAAPVELPFIEPVEKEAEKIVRKKMEEFSVSDVGFVDSIPSTPGSNSEKKNKREKPRLNSITDDVLGHLLKTVKKSQLNDAEIQTLIDVLLNMQNISGVKMTGEWVEKGDPVVNLKKQVEELESQLMEKDVANGSFLTKITNLRSDLNNEKAKSNSLNKHISTISGQMQVKMDAVIANHNAEVNAKVKDAQVSLEKEYQQKLQQQKHNIIAGADVQIHQMKNALAEAEGQSQNLKVTLQEAENQVQLNRDAILEGKAQQHYRYMSTLLAETQVQLENVTLNSNMCMGAIRRSEVQGSPELKEDLMKVLNHCQKFVSCYSSMKCEKKKKALACIKQDLRKHPQMFELLQGLDGILDGSKYDEMDEH